MKIIQGQTYRKSSYTTFPYNANGCCHYVSRDQATPIARLIVPLSRPPRRLTSSSSLLETAPLLTNLQTLPKSACHVQIYGRWRPRPDHRAPQRSEAGSSAIITGTRKQSQAFSYGMSSQRPSRGRRRKEVTLVTAVVWSTTVRPAAGSRALFERSLHPYDLHSITGVAALPRTPISRADQRFACLS